MAAAVEAAERRTVRDILTTFADQELPVLLLKGGALSYSVYAMPWLRPRTDTDLLVPPGSMDEVSVALGRLGFVSPPEVTHPLITRQRHFMRPGALPAAVDVHEALVNPPVLRHLPDFATLNPRAQALPALHPAARALGTADALLHALVHRVAHHNSAVDLIWLYDIRLLAARMTDADWDVLVRTAQHAQVCRIAGDGLELAVTVLDAAVPATVRDRLSQAGHEPSAALIGGELTELHLQWINFRSLEGLRMKATFLRAHLFPPSGELAGPAGPWPLPVRYVVRAVRGLRKWRAPIAGTH